MTEQAESATEVGVNVIDGRRKRVGPANPVKASGFDFPVPGGGSIRLPYPSLRVAPLFRTEQTEEGESVRVELVERIGYAPLVQIVVDKFLDSFKSGDEKSIFAAAVVTAWALICHRRMTGDEPYDPARLFEMNGDDALVFVYRMVRLVGGLDDLERDADGYFLLPVGSNEDQPSEKPIESDDS